MGAGVGENPLTAVSAPCYRCVIFLYDLGGVRYFMSFDNVLRVAGVVLVTVSLSACAVSIEPLWKRKAAEPEPAAAPQPARTTQRTASTSSQRAAPAASSSTSSTTTKTATVDDGPTCGVPGKPDCTVIVPATSTWGVEGGGGGGGGWGG